MHHLDIAHMIVSSLIHGLIYATIFLQSVPSSEPRRRSHRDRRWHRSNLDQDTPAASALTSGDPQISTGPGNVQTMCSLAPIQDFGYLSPP